LKRDSQPELYLSSGESRCFLFVQVSTKRGASSTPTPPRR
jgi:hypothetical protein